MIFSTGLTVVPFCESPAKRNLIALMGLMEAGAVLDSRFDKGEICGH
jgi:hypothetical protein